jgi:hypothetical protein
MAANKNIIVGVNKISKGNDSNLGEKYVLAQPEQVERCVFSEKKIMM